MKKVSVWLMLLLCFCTGVFAQDTSGVKQRQSWSFSLERAQQYALENNRSIKKAGLAVQQAQAAKWVAIANYLPQSSASLTYTNYLGESLSIMGLEMAMTPSSTVTVQLSQAILNANILVGVQLADIGLRLSQNAVEQTDLAVKQNVNTSYYSILVLEENKRILGKNLANVRILAKATRDKVRVGIGEPTEADQMEVTVANLENALQSTELNIEMAYNSMRLLLGVGVNDDLKLTGELADLTEKSNTFELLAQPFELDQNIDKQSSDLNLEMNKKQYESSIASLLPTLNGSFQHNEKLKTSGFSMTMKNMVVLSASVPLYNSGKGSSTIKKAKLAYQSAQIDHDLAIDNLFIQEKQLRFNLKSAQSGYEIQKKNIEVSQRVFDNITKKYEQGLSSSLELTTANNSLLTAQSNYISAIMTLLNAQDALQKLLGTL
jgi:outer membrane protein TolC